MLKAGVNCHWRLKPPASLSHTQKKWLMRTGALTSGLRLLGSLKLRVLSEYSCGLSRDEARSLKIAPRSPVWIREVVMSIDGTDCVVARSLAPLVASHGVWQGMRKLRSRPLADILYKQRTIARSAFEVARLKRTIPLFKTAQKQLTTTSALNKNKTLFARRSVFWSCGYPLLVAECFLPAFWLKASAYQSAVSPVSPVRIRIA